MAPHLQPIASSPDRFLLISPVVILFLLLPLRLTGTRGSWQCVSCLDVHAAHLLILDRRGMSEARNQADLIHPRTKVFTFLSSISMEISRLSVTGKVRSE
uniref:Uncharacterized protein n=1 Tax=Kalanchoe fedtschenkoi TaxID=63787 RepID=A0A7N1A6Q9_KALFE